MKKGDLIFVYGTLRSGQGMGLDRSPRSKFIGTDRINGKMYDISWFPGVKTEPVGEFDAAGDIVEGDVFEILHDSQVASLDSYEGYPNLYNRIVTKSEAGRDVWVYVYNHPVREERRIQSGSWLDRPEIVEVVEA